MHPSNALSGTAFLTAILCACGSPAGFPTTGDAGATATLAVSVSGCCGKVTSEPSGIDCPGTACSAQFVSGTRVTLSADAAPFSALLEWAGSCSGPAGCSIKMDSMASVSGAFGPGRATQPLAVGAGIADALQPGHAKSYSVAVVAGAMYSAGLVGASDSAELAVYDEHNYPGVTCGAGAATGAAGECRFTAATSTVYLVISPAPESRGRVTYGAVIAPVPAVPLPVSEGGRMAPVVIAPGTAIVGEVATRGTSFYSATLDPTRNQVVAITALSGDADLHVFPDDTFSIEMDCTLRRISPVLPEPQDCTVTGISSVYFSVTSGPLNREGGAYEIIVL